jgi:ATP-binding cassette subfamily B protein
LIRNPDLLILDDCLSAVDTITEEKILSNLAGFMKGRTTIVVSHRVSAVRNCSRILVLDGGRLVEEGSHATLLRAGGMYAQLHELQLAEVVDDSGR